MPASRPGTRRPRLVLAVLLLGACSGPLGGGDPPLAASVPGRATPATPDALDALVRAHWREAGVEPAPAVDDAAFLRRASLDLLGRIPTTTELDAYLADPAADRRARAVDRMLASDEQAEHLAEQTTELLLGRALQVPPPLRDGTRAWLRERFVAEDGWDDVARDVLTAEGELAAEGPAGFVLAHGRRDRTAALAGESARVFLGASIQCAQCHDHPDDPTFTQRDFYGMVAFFARTKARPTAKRSATVTVVDRRRGEARMPLAGDAPEKPTGEVVPPSWFGEPVAIDAPTGRRRALADAMVGDPAFARAYVNRTWAELFGRGWIEPVDALPRRTPPPAVLEALARDFVANDHDVDALLRAIVLSEAYGRDSRADGSPQSIEARVAAFAQAAVRPVDAEAIVKSLAVVAGAGTDDPSEMGAALRRKRGALRELRFTFADDEGASESGSGSVPQALLLQNGELVQMAVRSRGQRGLGHVLATHDDPAARVDALVRTVYARPPTTAERDRVLALLRARGNQPAAYEDVLAALLSSSEFLTNH